MGVISVEPGGFNVVPGAAEITIDVRSPSVEGFAGLEPLVQDALERIAAEEELGLELRETHRSRSRSTPSFRIGWKTPRGRRGRPHSVSPAVQVTTRWS